MGVLHTVVQGESLSLIALAYGYSACDWPVIYDHGENTAFRALRPDPNLIFPGDQVFVPTEEAPPSTTPAETGKLHVFRLVRPRTRVHLVLEDRAGESHGQCRFSLEVEGVSYDGFTGDDGELEVEVPTSATLATLTAWTLEEPEVWTLQIGHLDPVETTSGVQARLNNLSIDSGPVDGISGPLTQAAIREFQESEGLTVDGISGPQTQAALVRVYGC